MVATKKEYYELVKTGSRGEYPRVLTSNGISFGQEYHDNYDQWRPDDTIICRITCSDDWPTFREATEMRRTLKRKQI